MKFQADNFYHIFNRGNNRQKIFLTKENYLFFLDKITILLAPHCSILCYCLMPNHFHLLVHIKKKQDMLMPTGNMQVLERKIGTLQSSYTRAINKQEQKSGGLFEPKCKVLPLDEYHAVTCFHYIHQNPTKAQLVKNLGDWEFSSYREYLTPTITSLCEKDIAFNLLRIPAVRQDFEAVSLQLTEDL